jgi:ABC-type lipoprotein release transport system permease subunit
VLLRGVEGTSFRAVTALAVNPSADGAVVGEGLAETWGLRDGDTLTLLLAAKSGDDLPLFLPVKVQGRVRHGLHEKDSRLIYVDRAYLATQLAQPRANLALLAFPAGASVSDVERRVGTLREELPSTWNVRAAWHEFGGILEAARVEKTTITVILQLIVLVAVFNVAAFLITLRVRKTQEFFLVCAVGLPRNKFLAFGRTLLFAVWALSCACALVMVWGFDFLLAHASWLQVPGDIYLLNRLRLVLEPTDYAAVFLPAMAWIALVGWFTVRRLRTQSLLTGLRQEFA